MSATIKAAIVERLHLLDDRQLAQVLDFVEFLLSRTLHASSRDREPTQPTGQNDDYHR